MPAILLALVPLLVSQAEKLFGSSSGASKRSWVMDAMKEIQPLLARIEPDWIKKNAEALESIVDVAIEFALDKLEA